MQKSKGRYAKFANRAKERETQKNPMKRLENFYRHSDSFALDKALENVGHRTNAVNHPPVLYEWDIESVGSVNVSRICYSPVQRKYLQMLMNLNLITEYAR